MDEEAERLREIFLETTGEEVATESQRADRGSLLDDSDADPDRLPAVVAELRGTLGVDVDLDDAMLARVVRLFYGGEDDAAIADDLGVDEATVFRARTDLHLLREDDADPDLLAAALAGDEDALAAADPGARERAERVARAQRRSRRASERFRTAFEELLTDADLSGSVVGDARADGLREAAADIEPDVDLDF